MKKSRVGIFGGTFAPPHIGHVNAAKAFAEQADLDKLLVVPAFIPPHKSVKFDATPNQRLEMTKIAFSGICKAEVSDIEIAREGTSYTVDTLRELHNNSVELLLFCGTDMLLSLDRWYMASDIFKLAEIAYVNRTQNINDIERVREKAAGFRQMYGARVTEISVDVIDISSSRIREMIAKGNDISEYLQADVVRYIKRCGIFKT